MNKLRALAPDDDIVCVTAQFDMPYNTCLLADYLSEGRPPATLWTKTQDFFTKNDICLRRGTRAMLIEPEAQEVITDSGEALGYDSLFLGLGTSPLHLPVEAEVQSGLFNFHTLADTYRINNFIRHAQPRTAIVIGAGLSGVECADALTERGIHVTIVEGSKHLLATLINPAGSRVIEKLCKKADTTFYPGCRVSHILVANTGKVHGIALQDGTKMHADMVVVAIGARPNTGLARQAGLTLEGGGIAVNQNLQTSNPTIFAAGDVASVPTRCANTLTRSCTWPDAMQQGMFAAKGIAGADAAYPGVTTVLSSQFYGTQFVSCGPVVAPPKEYLVHEASNNDSYYLYLTHNDVLKGFLLVGALGQIGLLRRMVTTGAPIDVATLPGMSG